MSYTPTEWAKGDVVTSAKLNKLEQGVADAVFVFAFLYDDKTHTYSADKPYADILAAYESGIPIFCATFEGDKLHGVSYVEGEGFFVEDFAFNNIGQQGACVFIMVYNIAADGTVTTVEGEYELTPV